MMNTLPKSDLKNTLMKLIFANNDEVLQQLLYIIKEENKKIEIAGVGTNFEKKTQQLVL